MMDQCLASCMSESQSGASALLGGRDLARAAPLSNALESR